MKEKSSFESLIVLAVGTFLLGMAEFVMLYPSMPSVSV